MGAPNFELVTELQTLTRRDFPADDPTILKPLDDSALVDGEWLEFSDTYTLKRGSGGGRLCVYPVHTERGRYDAQALGKINVLFLGQFEAETAVVDPTGYKSLVIGSKLMVCTISGGTFDAKRGLTISDGKANSVEVGYVTKLPSSGKVRFVRTSPILLAALT
jgi:hypothetical protein